MPKPPRSLQNSRGRTGDSCTLSLHDALPISGARFADTFVTSCTAIGLLIVRSSFPPAPSSGTMTPFARRDRKSTRLNSSHITNSYAVFCLKKKSLTLLLELAEKLELSAQALV